MTIMKNKGNLQIILNSIVSEVKAMSILSDYVQAEAEKKGSPPGEWLKDIAKNAGKCQFATHIGRFANPDVTVNWQAKIQEKPDEPYVSTASAKCRTDIFVAANYLATASLLQLQLEDGRTFYEHLQDDESQLRQEFNHWQLDYEQVREDLLAIKSYEVPTATDTRLKQVYFPVGDDDYHLLTVLPPSSLMQEVRTRIRRMETDARKACDKKSAKYGSTHRRIYNLTQTKFGGTNPRNISFANMHNGGRSYMLPAIPPQITKRDVLLPKRDFFKESLRLRNFANLLRQLHGRYADKRNNMDIRQAARSIERQIMEVTLQQVYVLRQQAKGWSDGHKLNRAQAIWLDDKYAEIRLEETAWQKELADRFARWIIDTYLFVLKKDGVELGDGELAALKKETQEFIKEDLRKQ